MRTWQNYFTDGDNTSLDICNSNIAIINPVIVEIFPQAQHFLALLLNLAHFDHFSSDFTSFLQLFLGSKNLLGWWNTMSCNIFYVYSTEALMVQERKNILLSLLKQKWYIMRGHNSFFIVSTKKENKPAFIYKFNCILGTILSTLCICRSYPPSLDVSPPTTSNLLLLFPSTDDYLVSFMSHYKHEKERYIQSYNDFSLWNIHTPWRWIKVQCSK